MESFDFELYTPNKTLDYNSTQEYKEKIEIMEKLKRNIIECSREEITLQGLYFPVNI
jgi:hypothetical protein